MFYSMYPPCTHHTYFNFYRSYQLSKSKSWTEDMIAIFGSANLDDDQLTDLSDNDNIPEDNVDSTNETQSSKKHNQYVTIIVIFHIILIRSQCLQQSPHST